MIYSIYSSQLGLLIHSYHNCIRRISANHRYRYIPAFISHGVGSVHVAKGSAGNQRLYRSYRYSHACSHNHDSSLGTSPSLESAASSQGIILPISPNNTLSVDATVVGTESSTSKIPPNKSFLKSEHSLPSPNSHKNVYRNKGACVMPLLPCVIY